MKIIRGAVLVVGLLIGGIPFICGFLLKFISNAFCDGKESVEETFNWLDK